MTVPDGPTSVSPERTSFRIHPLTAEFADAGTEQAYRQAALPSMQGDFRAAIAVAAVFYLGFGVADYASLGATPQFWMLIYVRAFIMLAGFAAIQFVARFPALVTSGYGATLLEILAIAGNFIVVITRPADLAAHASAMIVILFAIFVFVPNRFVFAVGTALFGTASFALFLLGWAKTDSTTLLSVSAVLLLINTFGIVASHRFSRLRRREFAALESERQSTQALLDEIAHRENLEAALIVEKNAAERARDQAEAASRAKSRFLASASHDLRQPMHALSLFAATLVERLRYPEVRQIADQMQASIVSLTSLFDSLLDISKLDAGTVQTHIVSFPLQNVFDSVRRDFSGRASHKGLRLHVVPTHAVVRSDPILIERIVRNLASNAVNYTQQGGVVVGARRRAGRLCIQVWDSGPGIPAGEQAHIFEEFYQISNPERDRSKGLGLGLAIVKRLADLLKHPIDLRSRPGRGTVFSITVPRGVLRQHDRLETAEPPVDMASHATQRVVVLIEDERIIREATQTLLSDWGCEVVASATQEEALAELARIGKSPDLIIADYRLGGGSNGIEAIQTIQTVCRTSAPGVLVTGDAATEHLKQAQAMGYPVLHKPVAPAKLRALIASIHPRDQ